MQDPLCWTLQDRAGLSYNHRDQRDWGCFQKKLSAGMVELDVDEVPGKGTAVKEGEAGLLCAHMHGHTPVCLV